MSLVKVTFKNGKIESVLPEEVPGLKRAGLLKEEKDPGQTKEEKSTGETKEEKVTGKVKSVPITTRNVKGRRPKKI